MRHETGGSAPRRTGRGRSAVGVVLVVVATCAGSPAPAAAAISVGEEHTFPGGDNRSCDIAIHPKTGQPHVVWETNDRHLKHSRFDGSRWSTPEQVPGPANVGAQGQRLRQSAVTMVIDSEGRVHVVYVTGGGRNAIWHIRRAGSGGGWSKPVLVHNAGRAQPAWVQMARNRRDRLFLSFEMAYRAYAREFSGSSWTRPRPLLGLTSHVHHIAMRPDGVPCVLFKGKKRGGYEGYVALRLRSGWKVTQVTQDGGGVDCPSGAFDARKRLHVIWSRCAEEGHDATLKYGSFTGALLTGERIAKTNAHNFCRLIVDQGGALYAFMPRRYPPKVVVRESKGGKWSDPIPLGPPRQGYGFFEAAAHGNEVHLVYSSAYGPDQPKPVAYRKITRGRGPASKPQPKPQAGTELPNEPSRRASGLRP